MRWTMKGRVRERKTKNWSPYGHTYFCQDHGGISVGKDGHLLYQLRPESQLILSCKPIPARSNPKRKKKKKKGFRLNRRVGSSGRGETSSPVMRDLGLQGLGSDILGLWALPKPKEKCWIHQKKKSELENRLDLTGDQRQSARHWETVETGAARSGRLS